MSCETEETSNHSFGSASWTKNFRSIRYIWEHSNSQLLFTFSLMYPNFISSNDVVNGFCKSQSEFFFSITLHQFAQICFWVSANFYWIHLQQIFLKAKRSCKIECIAVSYMPRDTSISEYVTRWFSSIFLFRASMLFGITTDFGCPSRGSSLTKAQTLQKFSN